MVVRQEREEMCDLQMIVLRQNHSNVKDKVWYSWIPYTVSWLSSTETNINSCTYETHQFYFLYILPASHKAYTVLIEFPNT
jgi:hypothetical protein